MPGEDRWIAPLAEAERSDSRGGTLSRLLAWGDSITRQVAMSQSVLLRLVENGVSISQARDNEGGDRLMRAVYTACDELGCPEGVWLDFLKGVAVGIIRHKYRIGPKWLDTICDEVLSNNSYAPLWEAASILKPSHRYPPKGGRYFYKSAAHRRLVYRSRVLNFIRDNEGCNRAEVYRRLPEISGWLRRDDRGWLEEAFKPLGKYRKGR
jgi:hypothetical protein